MTWSKEWKQDLLTWLEESRGDWKGLSEALGSEGPSRLRFDVVFAVDEVNASLFDALDGIADVSAENLAASPDSLRVTFVREEGHPGRANQIVVLSGETFMHILGMLLDAVGGEEID